MTVLEAESPYLNVLAKKRAWQPVAVAKGQVTEGAEDTLFKALALRHLEIPVKELLEEGMKRELPKRLASLKPCVPIRRTRIATWTH